MQFNSTPVLGFFSTPLHDDKGGTWTLTTALSRLLHELEEIAGPRDSSYTIVGIEFYQAEENIPHIWYPGNRRHVAIRLTANAAQDLRRAIFQLAHEVVHLLSPSGGRKGLRIEEGFATWFADQAARRYVDWNDCEHIPSYATACDDVKLLLQRDPRAIKHIREKQPILWKLTRTDILAALPDTDARLADRLCEPFVRGN